MATEEIAAARRSGPAMIVVDANVLASRLLSSPALEEALRLRGKHGIPIHSDSGLTVDCGRLARPFIHDSREVM